MHFLTWPMVVGISIPSVAIAAMIINANIQGIDGVGLSLGIGGITAIVAGIAGFKLGRR